MARRYWRRAGLVLSGLLLGSVLVLVGVYVYFRVATDMQLAESVLRTLDLPEEVLELEALEADSVARVVARDVAIVGENGDTVLAAPTLRLWVDLLSLAGDGPIEIVRAVAVEPSVNLVQLAGGGYNLAQAFAVTAGGEEVEDEGRGLVIRDLAIVDGRARVTLPPAEEGSVLFATEQGAPAGPRVLRIADVDADLPLVRFGGERGWRVEVAELTASLLDPDVRILALEGFAEQAGEDGVRFAVDRFLTGDSRLEAAGVVRFAGEQPTYDVLVRAAPLHFGDLQWLAPALPAGGEVAGVFQIESRPGGRVAVAATELVVTAFDSRITGQFTALTGGEAPITFTDTRLLLDPVRLETLEQLGLVEQMQYTGEIRGAVTSAEASAEGGALQLDLAATFAPRGADVPVSTVFAQGPVTLGGEAAVRFQGLRLTLQPLYLAALRPLAPEQQERLRGVLRGTALLTGTPADLAIREGSLAYEVGDAPATRLTGISLDLQTEPALRFSLEARAEPLALATLSELFPAFPFRTARFSGPIRIAGTADQLEIDAQLSGAAGLFAVQGTVSPGEVLRFDLSGRVAAFSPEAVLTRSLPVDGPVSGTFAVAGSAQDFRFNVDLAQETDAALQGGGRFALQGRIRQGAAAPQFEVAGTVTDFNLGALIGRPGLFPSRLSGRVNLAGGGRAPYRFDVDLRGPSGVLDLEGTYATGDVPVYRVSGTVAGLNLQQLPGGEALPQTSLNATIDVRGEGATLQTLAGNFRISAGGSTIAGLPVSALQASLAVRDGVLVVDTLAASIAGTQLTASGTWGLTRPAADPLAFRLVSRDLGRLAPLLAEVPGLEPQVTGSFLLQGTVAGSVERPVVDVAFRGQNLRYEGWRARQLQFQLAATLGAEPAAIQGDLTLSADDVLLAGTTSLSSLRLELDGSGERVAVNLAVARPGASDVAVAGVLELEGRAPRGVLLDELVVRAGDVAWQLQGPAALRWGGVEGVRISNLLLRRTGNDDGFILVDGALPPTGNADLRVTVDNFDMDLVRRLSPVDPEIDGVLSMQAVLQGPVSDPELFLDGRVTRFQYRGIAADSVVLDGRYDERRMQVDARIWNQATPVAIAEAAIPMVLAFENSLPAFQLLRTEPLRASIVADSLSLALLAAAAPSVTSAAGVVSAELTAAGTIERPTVEGWAEVRDGALQLEALDVLYTGIQGRLRFDGDVARIDSLTIRSNGVAVVDGTVRLANLDNPELYLTASFESFHAIDNEDLAELTLTGNVALSGRMAAPVLTGRVVVEEGTIYIPSVDERIPLEITDVDVGQIGADTVSAQAVGPGFANLQIQDLTVVVEEGVWLEADEARVEIRGELVVFRTGTEPRIYGTLQAVRGTYALTIGPIIREFDVVSGQVRFFGTPDLNPEIDITASHQVRSVAGGGGGAAVLNILVRVTGTVEYPRVVLTSDTRPPLPESELINYLVFGQPSFRLTQQTGLAQQLLVQELLGGLLVQELGQLGLPCEYLRLRGRPSELPISSPLNAFGATTLECGVQVLPDVFLTLETGVTSAVGGGNPLNALVGISLDWQINDFVSARAAREPVRSGVHPLLTTQEAQYQWSADVKGTWEFGRPRNEEPLEPQVPEERLPGEVAPPRPLPPPPSPTPPAPVPEPAPQGPPPPDGAAQRKDRGASR